MAVFFDWGRVAGSTNCPMLFLYEYKLENDMQEVNFLDLSQLYLS